MGRIPVLAALGTALLLGGGLLCLHGQGRSGGCPGTVSALNFPPLNVGTKGGAGWQIVPAISGPLKPSPTPQSRPVVVNGNVAVAFADSRSILTLPMGTVLDISLTSGPWSVPVSSDPKPLPLISSSTACDGSVKASFRVQGNGWIQAETHSSGNGEGAPDLGFRITVIATS